MEYQEALVYLASIILSNGSDNTFKYCIDPGWKGKLGDVCECLEHYNGATHFDGIIVSKDRNGGGVVRLRLGHGSSYGATQVKYIEGTKTTVTVPSNFAVAFYIDPDDNLYPIEFVLQDAPLMSSGFDRYHDAFLRWLCLSAPIQSSTLWYLIENIDGGEAKVCELLDLDPGLLSNYIHNITTVPKSLYAMVASLVSDSFKLECKFSDILMSTNRLPYSPKYLVKFNSIGLPE